MARLVSLATLIADTRRWANIRTSNPDDAHMTDTDVARVLELKLAEFHEMLTSATASAFVETVASVTVTSGSGPLPDDFFRLNAAWIEWSTTDHESLANLANQQDATFFQGVNWTQGAPKAFRVVGSTLRLFPQASATIKISYVPAFVQADEYDAVNGWEKYVTLGAAIELLAVENRSNATLEREYQKQEERILSMVEERQAQDAPRIRDAEWPSVLAHSVGGGGGSTTPAVTSLAASAITFASDGTPLYASTAQAAIVELAGLATMEALRAIAPTAGKYATTLSYAIPGDEGGGFWRAAFGSPGDYTHNGGTVIVPSGGNGSAAWLREEATPVRPEWFGAKGDGVTDDSTAINDASDWVSAQGGGSVLFTAPSYAFTFTQPPANVVWTFAATDIGRDELGGTSSAVRYIAPRFIYLGGPHATEQYSAEAMRVIAQGSGQIGAQYADYCKTYHIEKEFWSETSGTPAAGEINCLNLMLRTGVENGGDKSGGAAILADIGMTADSGFTQLIEAVNSVFTKGTLAVEKQTRVQMLGIEDRLTPDSSGVVLISEVGTQNQAHLVRGTTASRWTVALNCVLDSISRFIISDIGRLRWRSTTSVNIEVSQEDATGDLVFKDTSSAEFYRLQQDKGRRAPPVVDTTTAITLDKQHSGRIVLLANGSGITATLDAQAPIGTSIRVIQRDAGQVTFAAEGTGQLRNRSTHTKTAGQYAAVTLEVTTNSDGNSAIWYLSGDTAA